DGLLGETNPIASHLERFAFDDPDLHRLKVPPHTSLWFVPTVADTLQHCCGAIPVAIASSSLRGTSGAPRFWRKEETCSARVVRKRGGRRDKGSQASCSSRRAGIVDRSVQSAVR